MTAGTAHKIVLFSAIGTFGAGWFNASRKGHKTPSKKFFVGFGISFTALSFVSDVQPDVAGALAMAMLTTVAFGEGGGLLKYLNDKGEVTTPTPPKKPVAHPRATNNGTIGQVPGMIPHR